MSAQLRDQQPQPIKILAHTINPQYANNNFQSPTTELTKSTFDKSSHAVLIEKWSFIFVLTGQTCNFLIFEVISILLAEECRM